MLRGAEAVLVPDTFLGHPVLRKERRKKGYRIKEIDGRIRIERTRREARLLHKAKLAGVSCPIVYEVGADYIVIGRVKGRKLPADAGMLREAGGILGRLHSAGIIHGDFTPYNIIVDSSGKLHVIDFGLGFFSRRTEDFADDVITMLRSIRASGPFLEGYRGEFGDSGRVLEKIEEIGKRARYR